MKFLKTHWLKIGSICLISIICVYVSFFAIRKAKDYEIYKEQKIETKIYTIWNVETFEGGAKPRINYLKNIAKEVEKQHDGVSFMIKTIDSNLLENELKYSTPDIISFGYGVGKIFLPYLKYLNKTFDVRDELIESGSFNGKLYALPYIVSGYAFFSHETENDTFYCGKTEFTKPETVYTSLNLTPNNMESQYESYKHFINNKKSCLLGTARDLYRISNLNNIGRTNASITPINTYTDLLQYVGVTKLDAIIDEFLYSIFSKKNQSKLSDYSLFSSLYNKIYSSGIYANMEEAIFECEIAKCFEWNLKY